MRRHHWVIFGMIGATFACLTCLTPASVRQQSREAGCQRFLLKPCLSATLAGEIRDALLAGKDDVAI